jgi:hypothetical protein
MGNEEGDQFNFDDVASPDFISIANKEKWVLVG